MLGKHWSLSELLTLRFSYVELWAYHSLLSIACWLLCNIHTAHLWTMLCYFWTQRISSSSIWKNFFCCILLYIYASVIFLGKQLNKACGRIVTLLVFWKQMARFFFCFCVPQLYVWVSPFWVRFLHTWLFFHPTIEVVTFHLRGWCMLGVFLLLAFTRLRHECLELLSLCDGMHLCTD